MFGTASALGTNLLTTNVWHLLVLRSLGTPYSHE